MFDIAYIGHYTQDTIVYTNATRVVDGGAFNYGANVAARLGMKVAVVTRLARADWRVIENLENLGVTCFARATPASTCLKLIYPTANLDERIIEITSSAGAFTVDEVAPVQARAFALGASVRGEAPTQVVEAIANKGGLVVLDVQGFLRVARDGKLVADEWRDKADVLRHVSILKTDAVEAALITGEPDRYAAARQLAAFGPREILLTHNASVLVYFDGKFAEAPLAPRELRGRSGRGDTCTSAYISRRLSAPPEDAVVWAAAVTTLKLEAEGPFNRTRAEVEELYARLKSG